MNRKRSLLLCALLILLTLQPSFASDLIKVTRVVDGDTIIVNLNGKQERVRLIGVDTPETVDPRRPVQYFGKEASNFTKKMLSGKQVRLEYDWNKRDKYNRLLAYVYLPDGAFFNAELIKQGYAHAYTRFPFKYLEEFRKYEREARENSRGLWGKTDEEITEQPVITEKGFIASKNSDVFHKAGCPVIKRIKPENITRFNDYSEAIKSGRRLSKDKYCHK